MGHCPAPTFPIWTVNEGGPGVLMSRDADRRQARTSGRPRVPFRPDRPVSSDRFPVKGCVAVTDPILTRAAEFLAVDQGAVG